MDLKALEYTRDHYNRHAGQYADAQEALRARATGLSAPLKKFHNTIKRNLIDRFARDADSLLDLACGRGGDILKWIDSKIKYVKGIDLSPGEIEEANQRYQRTISEGRAGVTKCEFLDTPNLGIADWKEAQEYDVITCMFALHYFFVSEAALKQFLHNVSINLRPGGYFIGTVPDGKRINECIRSRRVFESPMLRIEAKWQGMPAVFGSPYICAIGDTVTGGEQGTAGSLEYLVYENVLAGVAAQYGLKPVLDYQAPNLESCLDPADGGKLLKHFLPVFPQSDPSLERASALFTTFVFQKTDAPEGRAPPLPGLVDATKARVPVLKRAREEQEAGPRGGAGEEPEAQKVKSGSGVEAAEEAAETAAPASGEKQAVKASSYKRPPPRKKPGAAGAEARDAPAAPPEGTA